MTSSSYSCGSHRKGQPLLLPHTTSPPWLHIYSDSPPPFLPFHPTFRLTSSEATAPQEVLSLQGNPPSLRSMAEEWWSSTSHRSHGASACSAAPLAVVTDRVACGWATSPTAATAESTSSITFQDPYRSSTHQPLSDAASSLGDPHADWTQAFL